MPTNQRSAAAYDKLSFLSAQADLAATIVFGWVKLQRAIDALVADLKLDESVSADLLQTIEDFRVIAVRERLAMRDYAARKQTEANHQNELIQNGVFSDD